jgi:propanediol utilization protein
MTTTLTAIAAMDEQQLEQVANACRDRRETLNRIAAAATLAEVQVGAKVRIRPDSNIRPLYLHGLVATVRTVNAYEVMIDFDDTTAAGRFARGCRCKPYMVEVIA